MAGIAWVNGKLVSAEEAAIAPADRGFLYGEGLFETMRAYRGRVFRLSRHLDRLLASAPKIDLTPPGRGLLERAVSEALAAGGMSNAVVRLTVTPGLGRLGEPTLVVLIRPLTLPPPEQYGHGCRAVSVPVAQVGSAPLRSVKSLNYLDKLLAQGAARWARADEAILVDPDGCVVEAAMRNVFAVVGGRLVTPPSSRGLLPGITREAVLEIAGRTGLAADERDLPLAELKAAEERFLTSSIAEILPVASVDGETGPAPGPITRRLTEGYRALVAEELGFDSEANRSG
jgi:branched-chain amino acid aminotransferase